MCACKDTEMFMNIFFKKAVIFDFKTNILDLKERWHKLLRKYFLTQHYVMIVSM